MAENEDVKSSKSRFLSKSKWGRVFKDTAGTDNAAKPNFELTDDVADFLRPSRDAAAERLASIKPHPAPKLNIAIAQRWPSAQEVRLASAVSPEGPESQFAYSKPCRRPGLAVRFAKVEAEVIGEGGEESEEPVSEISRRRILVARSTSERRSSALHGQIPIEPFNLTDLQNHIPPVAQLRRAQTSYNESSSSLAKKYASPPLGAYSNLQPSFVRSNDEPHSQEGDQFVNIGPNSSFRIRHDAATHNSGAPHDVRTIDTQRLNVASKPVAPVSPIVQKQQTMRNHEGMVLRRASAIFNQGEEEDDSATTTPQSSSSGAPNIAMNRSGLDELAQVKGSAMPITRSDRSVEARDRHQAAPPALTPQALNYGISNRKISSGNEPDMTQISKQQREASLDYAGGRSRAERAQQDGHVPTRSVDHTGNGKLMRDSSTMHDIQDSSMAPDTATPPFARQRTSSQSRSWDASARHNFSNQPSEFVPERGSEPQHVAAHQHAGSQVMAQSQIGQHGVVRAGSNHASGTKSMPQRSVGLAVNTPLTDFSKRVEHMRGVFRLTSDKERAAASSSIEAWLRAGLWWYLQAKVGVEGDILQRSRSGSRPQELLLQCHVNFAKALWILEEHLGHDVTVSRPHGQQPHKEKSDQQHAVEIFRSAAEGLASHMHKHQLMPPHQSLIQGQDIRIWLEYPVFTPYLASILSGLDRSSILDDRTSRTQPLEALPIGDSNELFCIARSIVSVTLATDERESDRTLLPCTCSLMRSRYDFEISVVIASQNDSVNVMIEPRKTREGSIPWSKVTWKTSSTSLLLHLEHDVDVHMHMYEHDFRRLWDAAESSRRVMDHVRPIQGETLIHEARLLELQYTDEERPGAFPAEKLSRCCVMIFERTIQDNQQRRYAGMRMVLVTEASHRNVVSVSHTVCEANPFDYDCLTDDRAQGAAAMIVRFQRGTSICRALLVFADISTRSALFECVTAMNLEDGETFLCRCALTSWMTAGSDGAKTSIDDPGLTRLHWQGLDVIGVEKGATNTPISEITRSEHLRLIIRHAAGVITDRMNLRKGELLIRLPLEGLEAIELYREPQSDITMATDMRGAGKEGMRDLADVLHRVQTQPNMRRLTFPSQNDMHAFQAAVTGYNVLFDGKATSYGISRRMMVVPIYHKWQTSAVRIQVVARSGVTKVLAFMDGFSHAEAMCFQIKSTDVLETGKGDGKGKKWTVKMIDAKFSLPRTEKTGDDTAERREELEKQRYVNLEGLEYAEEHDDITVGFDDQEERDAFAKALPATPAVSRILTLKRRP